MKSNNDVLRQADYFLDRVFDSVKDATDRACERGFTGLPAKILAFNAGTMLAQVQVLIQYYGENGEIKTPSPINGVPVSAVYGGDFFFYCEIKPGTEGWLDFSNRNISAFLNQGGPSLPNPYRFNSEQDCKFTPNLRSIPNVPSGFDNNGCAISSADGSKKVHLTDGSINAVFGSSSIVINGDSVKITAGGNSITINGSGVSTTGNLTNNGTNVGSGHVHGGVQSGPSTTGGPQ